MASTRNLNMKSDYDLEQKANKDYLAENLYIHSSSGVPTTTCIPTVGYTPSHMSRDAFSNNPIDIESQLKGIRATDLVNGCHQVVPSMKNLEFKSYFDRQQEVIMPYPLNIENNQRPNLS